MSHVYKLLLVVPLCAAWAASVGANEVATSPLGKKLDAFSLQDFRGKTCSLDEMKDAKLIVVAFLGVECPLSKLYGPRLAEMAKQYESKGVKFVGVDSNRQDSVTEMAQFAKVHNIEFPLLKDLNNTLADKLAAARNPQVYVLDGQRVVRYVGRVDDQYGFQTGSGYARPKSSHPELSSAIDELLDGKPVSAAVDRSDRLPDRPRAQGGGRQRRDLLETDCPHLCRPLRGMSPAGPDRPIRLAEL